MKEISIVNKVILIILFSFSVSQAQTFLPQTNIKLPNIGGKASWGDFDKDGFLDLLITGRDNNNKPTSVIYRNNGDGSFSEFCRLTGVAGVNAWGDYNNDGYLDIIMAGQDSLFRPVTFIYQNYGGKYFTKQTQIKVDGFQAGNVAWADFNNDGKLDFIISGNSPNIKDGDIQVVNGIIVANKMPQPNIKTKIYYNTGNNNFIEDKNNIFTGITLGSLDCGDYNNDGFIDIIMSGHDSAFSKICKVYRNNGNGTFSEQTDIIFDKLGYSSVKWGDYNNDGFLDILLSGELDYEKEIKITSIYKNNGNNTFSKIKNTDFIGVSSGYSTWVDYNNDGLLDIFISGYSNKNPVSILYRNDGNDIFSKQLEFVGVYGGSADWGDYDNDKKIDLILSGQAKVGFISVIYKNNYSLK